MYQPAPDLKELEGLGLTLDDVTDKSDVEVWPENWESYLIFRRLTTQWQVSYGGRTGLIYASLPVLFDAFKVPKKKRSRIFDDIQVMEASALRIMSK